MNPTSNETDSRTLWMGEIEHWMDENYISSLYASAVQGGQVLVKVIRDKSTGLPAGYSFVEFASHEIAQHVINTYNGSTIPGTHKTFKLNWGVFGGGAKSLGGNPMQIQNDHMQQMQQMQIPMSNFNYQQQASINTQAGQNDFSIYVGDIDPTVNNQQLADFFSLKFKSVISAKVIIDPQTKMGKGYGFVKFNDMNESNKACSDMNGALFRGRHIKTNSATWKSAQMANIQYQTQQINYMQDPVQQQYYGIQSYGDYQQQQYTQMIMQQQLLTQQQNMMQQIQQGNVNKHNNPQNYSKKVEKPLKPQKQLEEYSENTIDYILNKIEYETIWKFIE